MTRDELNQRLQEIGTLVLYGGVSDAYAGAKLWENLIEGTGGGGAGGKVPNFIPFHAARVAETLRAVVEGLDEGEQHTVFALYCSGLHTQQLQAASLSVKVPALLARRRKIFIKLLAWFTDGARAQRREVLLIAQAAQSAADFARHVEQQKASLAARAAGALKRRPAIQRKMANA